MGIVNSIHPDRHRAFVGLVGIIILSETKKAREQTSGIGRFGVLFFDDPFTSTAFLVACLVFLAVYLFFLQGKLFILGFTLGSEIRAERRDQSSPEDGFRIRRRRLFPRRRATP
ncbi:MAG: hypothetical protein MZU97_12925 [Bacillus subtilis]|nr:hypothetical protein [Bacillus subtilis]